MRIEHSERDQFSGLRVAVTARSTLVRIESRGDGALFPWRSVDGERCSEDALSQSRLRSVGLSEGFLGCQYMEMDKDDSSLQSTEEDI